MKLGLKIWTLGMILVAAVSTSYAETPEEHTYVPEDKVGDFKVYIDDLRFVRASWKGVPLLHKWGEIYTPIIWGFPKGSAYKGATIYQPVDIADPVMAFYVPDVPVRVTKTSNGVEYQWGFSYRQADFSKDNLYNMTYPKVTNYTHLCADVQQMNRLELTKDKLTLTTTIKFLNLPIKKCVHARPPSDKVIFYPVLFPGTGKDRKYLPELRIIGKDCKEINKVGEVKTVNYPQERESKIWLNDEPRSLIFDLEDVGKVRYNFSFSDPETSLLFYQHTGWPTPSLNPYVNPAIVGKITVPVKEGFKDGCYEFTMKMEVVVGEAVTDTSVAEAPVNPLPLERCFDIVIASPNASYRYFADEPLKFNIIVNGLKSDQKRDLTLKTRVLNYENKEVNHQLLKLSLPKEADKPLELLVPGLDKGAYVLEVTALEGRDESGAKAQRFCVLNRPVEYPAGKSFFGCMNGFMRVPGANIDDVKEVTALVRGLGMKKLRWTENYTVEWDMVEKEPGKWSFPTNFVKLDLVRSVGMDNFLESGSFQRSFEGHGIPEWAKSGKKDLGGYWMPRDLKEYEEYCYQVAKVFQGKISQFELENESDYTGCKYDTAARIQEYTAYMAEQFAAAYRGIKRAQPDAVIIAGTGGAGLKGLQWQDDLLSYAQIKGWKIMDVMAPHYILRGDYPEDSLPTLLYAQEITKRHQLGLWNGEDGRALNIPNSFHNIYPNYTFLDMEKGYANISVREHLLQKAYGVQYINLCHANAGPPRGMPCAEYESPQAGRFWGRGGFLKPVAVAYSTMAYLFEGAELDQRIDLKFKDAWCLAFKRADLTTAAIWLKEDKGTLDIDLSKGTEYINIMGSSRKMSGKQKFTVSEEPFYLTMNAKDSDKLIRALKDSHFTPEKLLELGKIDFTADKKAVQVLVKNFSSDKVKVQSMTLKYGQTELKLKDLVLPPDKETAVVFMPEKEIKGNLLAQVTAVTAGREYRKEEFVFYPSLQSAKSMGYLVAVKTKGPMEMDADLSEWKDAIPIVLNRKEQVGYWDVKPLDLGGWKGEGDLSAVGYVMWDDKNLYFACKVTDDVYANPFPEGIASTWNCDSIQMAFDPLMDNTEYGKGYNTDDQEINLALNQKGPACWRRTFWPSVKENPYAGKVTVLADGQMPGAKLAVKKEDKGMIYEFSIPLKELHPLEVKPGSTMRFNFVVNDDDGGGRKQWIGITPGIGEKKAPYLYKKVYFSE